MPKSLLKILFKYFVAITFFSPPVLKSEKFHAPGEKPTSTNFHAFVGGDIQVDPQTRLKKSTMLIRNGVIEKIGTNIPVPSFYREWNCSGKTIYPGLIDPYNLPGKKDGLLSLGHQKTMDAQSNLSFFGLPENSSDKQISTFGIPGVHPEKRLIESYKPQPDQWIDTRKLGYTAVHQVPPEGIFRGMGICMLISSKSENNRILKEQTPQILAFDPVGRKSSPSVYPNSLMGVISVIRQTFLKTDYARRMLDFEKSNPSAGQPFVAHQGIRSLLSVMHPANKVQMWFEPGSTLMIPKAIEIAKEFNLKDSVFVLTGDEWRRPDLAVSAKYDYILPLHFPAIPKLSDEEDWEQISLEQLRSWNHAPGMAKLVARKSKSLSFTTSGCSSDEFHKNLLKSISRGLTEQEALAALTINPAKICGISAFTGTLDAGKMANFFIINGESYFTEKPQLHSTWIAGKAELYDLQPKEEDANKTSTISNKDKLLASYPSAKRGPIDQPDLVLFENFTLWTCEKTGVLKDHDILVKNGKIQEIGKNLTIQPSANARIIKGKGKHLTPGIIDCHSHAMILGGVNESTLPSTAMVRVEDVVNSESINIERQLAGGVTACNLLHGSANPIGGQNAVIKLRLGASPQKLLFHEAPSGIKFALGENVKQSNWGDKYKTRFPQSRMGVKTFFENRFHAALAYEEKKNIAAKEEKPHLQDLEMEAILEIIHGKRLIHCHSYRQDEILVFLRTMESFGVRVASLQHVLEGYKVADEIARHGAGASTFSDWWAYKFEVYDAIPYAGAMMHQRGCIVSFNSDSPDHARRLNLEAAKAVKYGNLTEQEALKFVTLNPAIQLGIDSKVGSLKPGKDADFAIWTTHPLDYRAVCDQTWIDGKLYHDLQHTRKRDKERQKERNELLSLAREEVDNPDKEKPTKSAIRKFFQSSLEVTCDLSTHSCRSHDCLKKGGN
ncbi:MAG: amidohydrolase family protein [Opitutales bacterium]